MKKLKSKTVFICQDCGAKKFKWEGRCSDCNKWNTLIEEKELPPDQGRGWTIRKNSEGSTTPCAVSLASKITAQAIFRTPTGIGELDRVLGGGVVLGGFTLLGGDPGIGKSTLLLQMAASLSEQKEDGKKQTVLYISAEESVEQTLNRAARLSLFQDGVKVAAENNLLQIMETINQLKPQVVIIDSIQTIHHPEVTSAPGTVSQVRDCAGHLMSLAKSKNIAIFLIGHITKDGNIAGPKVLEHMVDCVLSFEGIAIMSFDFCVR